MRKGGTMKPVSPVIPGFEDLEVNIAKDQPEYLPLPSIVTMDGEVISRWELTQEEADEVARTRSVWTRQATFCKPVQPMLLSVEPPDLERKKPN
jgi:hypothetical protein